MTFRFVVDQVIKGRAYPALTSWQARPYTPSWRQFGSQWPWTTPLRIEEYCRQHSVPVDLYTLQQGYTEGSWYPICLGFFDFEIDYMALLPQPVLQAVKQSSLHLLFMYHEGDNPVRIKQRLDALCAAHALDTGCYVFVSANTRADQLPGFVCFHDFELWYHQRNIEVEYCEVNPATRTHDYLCLSRVHKSWRACITADLFSNGVLENSKWSYCMIGDHADIDDNPIQIDLIPRLRHTTSKFLESAPYTADDLTDDQRNDHGVTLHDLYATTRCNIILESQFDVDQSNGVFLTEKTFKAIKHGQMFFLAGAAGSLACLRQLGYQVFDDLFDNSYDDIMDHTQRYLSLRASIMQAKAQGLDDLYRQAQPQLIHNQQLFLAAPVQRLNTLSQKLDQHVSQ